MVHRGREASGSRLFRVAGPLSLALLMACRERPLLDPAPSAAASSAPAVDPHAAYVSAARAYTAVIQRYVETCKIELIGSLSFGASPNYCDLCEVGAASRAAESAHAELARVAVPPAPFAVRFAGAADAMHVFLIAVNHERVTRGSALLFERLAQAMNTLDPSAHVPLDPGPYYRQYTEPLGDLRLDYWGSEKWCVRRDTLEPAGDRSCYDHPAEHVKMKRFDLRKAHGSPLPWREGPQGPYLF